MTSSWLRGFGCMLLLAVVATATADGPKKPPDDKAPLRKSPTSTAPAPVSTDAVTRPPNLSADLTVWPNKACFRTSEPWILKNHDRIRKIKPRVMVLNFSNDTSMEHVRKQTGQLIKALAESTRYHGFKNQDAPAVLEYEVVKYVDLRDDPVPEERKGRNSSKFPVLDPRPKNFYCDYAQLYNDEYAEYYGFHAPHSPNRYLNLHQLCNSGLVHEVWMFCEHIYEDGWPAHEVIEFKQYYDEDCKPIPNKHGPAGNGHSAAMPWSGRTFRMAFFNPKRGIGCAMENFAHGLEGIANYNAIAYYRKYFNEYAELDLKRFYPDCPVDKLYQIPYDHKEAVEYPTKTSMKMEYQGKEYTIDPYINVAGNVHWAPGARHHYDLGSPYTVKSRIENYRLRNGKDGRDKLTDFNIKQVKQFEAVAPDCMGQWVVFWRQCMPGYQNKCRDDEGKPMKNWWVFLIY